jgi:hypothetical protein
MTTIPPLAHLRAVAEAASGVPMHHIGALIHYEQIFSPSVALALLARVRELEEGLAGTVQNFTKVQDQHVVRIRELEAGLVEALDRWEGWDSGSGQSSHHERIAELRAMAKP